MTEVQQGFPKTSAPFVDLKTGQVIQPWYRFLITLWNRTGANQGDVTDLPVTDTSTTGGLLSGVLLQAIAILRSGPVGDFSDITDTAKNYINNHDFPVAGTSNTLLLVNLTAFNWTITPGAGFTFFGNLSGGNFVIPANSSRSVIITINNIRVPAASIYG